MDTIEIAPGITIKVYWSDYTQRWVTVPEDEDD